MEEELNQNVEKKSVWKDFKFYYFLIDIALYLILILLFFAPSFILESGEESFEITYSNLIFGVNISKSLSLSTDVTALLTLIFCVLSLLFLLIGFFLKGKIRKVFFYLSVINLILSIISNILITYIFNSINENIGELSVISAMCLISIGCPIISLILTCLVLGDEVKFKTREIAEIAMLVALAIVLDKLKIQVGQSGGSINFSALPLMIIGIRYGFFKGVFASSIIFGIITNLLDGYGIACYPFDYLIAFAGYPLCGAILKLFKKSSLDDVIKYILSFIIGGLLMFVVRMSGSTMSSMILWEYELVPALSYNVLYIAPSALCSTILAIILSPVIFNINKRFPVKKEE